MHLSHVTYTSARVAYDELQKRVPTLDTGLPSITCEIASYASSAYGNVGSGMQ